MARAKPYLERPAPVPGASQQVAGRRYVRLLEDQLARLRHHRAHGNRKLFYDHVVIAHLLAFFNPGLCGLRGIEDLFNSPGVRKHFSVRRMPRSTLADAQRVFDPQLLLPLIASLRERARLQPHDPRLDVITRQLLAVDGSFFTVAPRIAWAVFNGSGKGNVKAHVQFDVLRGLPGEVALTDGQASESRQLRATLQAGRFYLLDRGYQQYQLLADILAAGSEFVVRLRQSATAETLEERPLAAADVAAGVVRDHVVRLGWRCDQTPSLPPLRRVEVRFVDRHGQVGTIILLSNRLDLPAWMIALLYQHRWQVELFFRWWKCVAHLQHFFSESPGGMTLQVYVTLIGLLLIAIETGAKPSKYDYNLMMAAVNGWASLEEVLEVAARRRAERARAAQWQRAYNARKKSR
jgi:IS4 transposase